MRNKFYYEAVKIVKEKLPLEYSVNVRRVITPKSIHGDCQFDENKKCFLIRINKKLSQFWAVDVFAHEWSHALSWKVSKKEYHGDAWGIAYALVYRTLLEHWFKDV